VAINIASHLDSPHVKMENAFAKSTGEVLKFFSVSEAQGLTDAQVTASREKYGRNGAIVFAPQEFPKLTLLPQQSQKNRLRPSGSSS